ncbi:MAG: glycine cleavage system protein GcvH [Thermoplasmatales archaeon]|nr:glycine cleavage system protein GcvH [Thermoplasmatales archaeon]
MEEVRDKLLYTKNHVWVRLEGAVARYGLTDYAQKELGEIVYMDMPKVGSAAVAGEEYGGIESLKSVGPLYFPVSGKIVEINEELEEGPFLINESPFDDGWLAAVEMSDPDEAGGLMSPKEYRKYLSTL